MFSCWFYVPISNSEPNVCLWVAWEWRERTLGVLGLSFDAVILWFYGRIGSYDHIMLWSGHIILFFGNRRPDATVHAKGFPVIFHEGLLPSWNYLFSLWFYVLISNSEPNVALWGACGDLGVVWKDAWFPGALIWCRDLMISRHDMMPSSYKIGDMII